MRPKWEYICLGPIAKFSKFIENKA